MNFKLTNENACWVVMRYQIQAVKEKPPREKCISHVDLDKMLGIVGSEDNKAQPTYIFNVIVLFIAYISYQDYAINNLIKIGS